MSVFARVNVAAAGDAAGLKSFKSKMENGKKLRQSSAYAFMNAQKSMLHHKILR